MNLLITGAWQQAKDYIEKIQQQGHSVAFLQYEKDALPCEYDWVEGVICNGLFLQHPIEKFKNLKYIQLTSAGFDRVPMEHVKEQHISIFNARGVYSIPMAEFAICGVLQLYKQARFFYKNQMSQNWDKHRGLLELSGKTVCIVGCGSVGTECAKRFGAFGCEVMGVNRTVQEMQYYDRIVGMEELDTVLAKADVLVLTIPLAEETRHLINERRLAMMKRSSILVNVARGVVVEQEALVKALEDHLGGAVLDVFEEEPLGEENPLWEMENVILTPHNSFVGDGNAGRLADVILCNLN